MLLKKYDQALLTKLIPHDILSEVCRKRDFIPAILINAEALALYNILALLTGVLISVMVTVNGGLTDISGVYAATVIIHVTGLLLSVLLLLIRRKNPFKKKMTWSLYLGGALGVATTVFNNMAFGRISVSSILAICLFGQSLTGLFIDQTGWMGMPKNPFRASKILGMLLIAGGIAAMTDRFELVPVVVSFVSGITIILSRTINARLSEITCIRTSTFYNYFVGLLVSLPVLFLFGGYDAAFTGFVFSPKLYLYLGGILGVCVVLLSNITVVKVSAFYLSLFLFIGQVFSGILIDMLIVQSFSPRSFAGGVMVAAGLCVNLLMDRRAAQA